MIDMHLHTSYSDGTDSVVELLTKAESLNLECISITDHDNCRAYNELKNINIKDYYSGKLVQGIEIKCSYMGRLIEVLGYNYDLNKLNEWIDEYYKDKQRKDLQIKYYNHLYDACMKKGLVMENKESWNWNPENDWASVEIYKNIKSHDENKEKLPEDLWEDFTTFTKKYCADFNDLFYIDKSKDYPTVSEAVSAIKKAGGKVFVAHVFIYKWAQDKEKLIEDLHRDFDIDGFECYHSNFSEEQIEYINDYCEKNNLLKSGGSDYHGKNKPGIDMASGKGNLHIERKIIENWENL